MLTQQTQLNKTKPTLLVVGDSFMTTDENYQGQHWSEMVTDYNVINFAQSGCTNFMIALQVMQALETLHIDAVVLGFTEENRLEFPYKPGQPAPINRHWYTSGATPLMNNDSWWKLWLSEFESHKVPLNLATYPEFKMIPGYHTDDPEWQQTFCNQAVEILKHG
jgi:hypothetical protein